MDGRIAVALSSTKLRSLDNPLLMDLFWLSKDQLERVVEFVGCFCPLNKIDPFHTACNCSWANVRLANGYFSLEVGYFSQQVSTWQCYRWHCCPGSGDTKPPGSLGWGSRQKVSNIPAVLLKGKNGKEFHWVMGTSIMTLCCISVWGHWALSFCIVEITGVQMINMLTIIFSFLQRPHKAKPFSFAFT